MQLHNPSFRRLLKALGLVGLVFLALPGPGFAGKEPKKRVAVVDFENKAGYRHRQGDIGDGLTEKLIEALIETDKFIVLERQALKDVLAEQNLKNVATVKPAVLGRLTGAQALIRGVVTHVEVTGGQEGGVRLGKVKVGGNKQKVSVKVNLRIIDTVTGQILESKTVEGTAKKRGGRLQFRSKDVETDLKVEDNVPVGEAADNAVEQAVEKIVAGMEKIPWQGSISRVSGQQIFINAGYQENVQPGLTLRVFEKGVELIDKETNESLGRFDEEIGVIEVQRVEARFSIAQVVQGQGFSDGNIVRPKAESR